MCTEVFKIFSLSLVPSSNPLKSFFWLIPQPVPLPVSFEVNRVLFCRRRTEWRATPPPPRRNSPNRKIARFRRSYQLCYFIYFLLRLQSAIKKNTEGAFPSTLPIFFFLPNRSLSRSKPFSPPPYLSDGNLSFLPIKHNSIVEIGTLLTLLAPPLAPLGTMRNP